MGQVSNAFHHYINLEGQPHNRYDFYSHLGIT